MKKNMLVLASALAFSGAVNATIIGDRAHNPCMNQQGADCTLMTTVSLPTLIVQGVEVARSSEAYESTLVREAQAVLRGERSALVQSVEQAEAIVNSSK